MGLKNFFFKSKDYLENNVSIYIYIFLKAFFGSIQTFVSLLSYKNKSVWVTWFFVINDFLTLCFYFFLATLNKLCSACFFGFGMHLGCFLCCVDCFSKPYCSIAIQYIFFGSFYLAFLEFFACYVFFFF